ncbi:hypothetical protein WR164_02450 [Philodulcilactobacillus myokoensis]|uniref:DUF3278 domain-containing protein n=1 Tax=Philodulcilactobacillus myokoensis TaxID=2929573 RepID=A0A9W6EQW5_9LACO|nr:hypothetical protein WR164_02450 [Philodulcilactobacillus myokoensis]
MDEYRKRKIEHLGTYLFMIDFILLIVMFLSIMLLSILNINQNQILFPCYLILGVVLLINWLVIDFYVQKFKLSLVEIDQKNIDEIRNKLIKRSIYYFVFGFTVMGFVSSHKIDGSLFNGIKHSFTNVNVIASNLLLAFFYSLMYFGRLWKNVRKFKN